MFMCCSKSVWVCEFIVILLRFYYIEWTSFHMVPSQLVYIACPVTGCDQMFITITVCTTSVQKVLGMSAPPPSKSSEGRVMIRCVSLNCLHHVAVLLTGLVRCIVDRQELVILTFSKKMLMEQHNTCMWNSITKLWQLLRTHIVC
jgi:hypothetical protein